MLTADEIRNVEFSKHMGGYKIAEVEAFVESCADTVATLTAEKEELNKKLSVFAEKIVEYRNQENSIQAALLTAQKMGESVMKEAEENARVIVADAHKEADRIVGSAKASIGEYEAEIVRLKKEVGDFKATILSLYKEHLSLLKKVPGSDDVKAVAEDATVVPPVKVAHEDDAVDAVQKASEDTTDAVPAQNGTKSKFANLKFGEDYNLDSDEDDE